LLALTAGQPQRALAYFQQELASAREGRDRLAQKSAHGHLGFAYSELRDAAQALPHYEQAVAFAREVGDRQQEANLLWLLAMQHAELGQPEQALTQAQAAVDLLKHLEQPHAGLYADYLQTYRLGRQSASLAAPPGMVPGAPIEVSGWAIPARLGPAVTQTVREPGLLRMAYSAAKAMAGFFRSGLAPVSSEVRQKRLQTCAACEHYTGMRCRLCGCFIKANVWMPYEHCPIDKWPV
jgi:tetratricopeptide (TPR) repeat protein